MTQAEEDAFEERLRRQIEAYHEAALLYAAVKLGIPEQMGALAWRAEELAAAFGLSAPHLARFLRGLCIIGICEERSGGSFTLTPFGRSLTAGSRLATKVQIVVEQYWMPWACLLWTLETGKPAFDDVFGMSISEWRRENPEQGTLFESYLTSETFDQGGSIIEALELAADAKRVAAIGGGCGALLAPLLIAHPHLNGVLFEQPHLIELAKPFLQAFGQFGLSERIELVAGDRLAEIPVKADPYLLKGVLPQHDNAGALAILRNCCAAMPDDARLAIIERLLPERATDDPGAIMLDLHMMAITGGRARSLAEFETLLSEAGFGLTNVTPTSSGLFVLDVGPQRRGSGSPLSSLT
jgi:hypothetical protein